MPEPAPVDPQAPTRMRAARYTRYGGPDVVAVTEVDVPTPGPGELLVEVHATTVNRTDCGYRSGEPFLVRFFAGLTGPRAQILGSEFAGRVAAVGADVYAFAVGDRVFGYAEGSFGGHAEFLTVAQDASIATIPDGVGWAEAAAATEGAHYALAFLRVAGIEGPGDARAALVYGATGAIGSAAVQILVDLGVEVTAVCGTDGMAVVETLGPDRVVDYQTEDFTADPRTYDVVLDAVGKSTFGTCKPLLRPGGTYVSSELGPWNQNVVLPLVTRFVGDKRVRFPFPRDDQAMIRHLADLLASGALRPVIDGVRPLDDVVDAYRYVESGRKIGNVVLAVTDDVDVTAAGPS